MNQTRSEVAAMLRISERHLRHLERLHNVPVLRYGRAVRYDATALAALKIAVVTLCERYAKLTPEGVLPAILKVWGMKPEPRKQR